MTTYREGRAEPMDEFEVRGDHITLGQFLKAVGAIGAGGEAREFLDEGLTRVNGSPETRRGRKLRPGDTVTLRGVGEWRMVGAGKP